MTKAESMARLLHADMTSSQCPSLETITAALEQYGRLVQEAAAKSIDDECERVLSTQRDAASGSQEDDANRYTRFMAVLLPDRAKAIREMPLP